MTHPLLTVVVALAAAVAGGCASRPLPAARVGSAEAATSAAKDAGAGAIPDAATHLHLAEQQIALARRLLDEGETERAEWFLVRAEADAAVASALAREAREKEAADTLASRAKAEAETEQ